MKIESLIKEKQVRIKRFDYLKRSVVMCKREEV